MPVAVGVTSSQASSPARTPLFDGSAVRCGRQEIVQSPSSQARYELHSSSKMVRLASTSPPVYPTTMPLDTMALGSGRLVWCQTPCPWAQAAWFGARHHAPGLRPPGLVPDTMRLTRRACALVSDTFPRDIDEFGSIFPEIARFKTCGLDSEFRGACYAN